MNAEAIAGSMASRIHSLLQGGGGANCADGNVAGFAKYTLRETATGVIARSD